MRRVYLRRLAMTLIWISGILIVGSFVAKEAFAYHGNLAFLPFFFAIGIVGLVIILLMGIF